MNKLTKKTWALLYSTAYIAVLMGGLIADFGEKQPAYVVDWTFFPSIIGLTIPFFIAGYIAGKEDK